jgi:hypothetical protein
MRALWCSHHTWHSRWTTQATKQVSRPGKFHPWLSRGIAAKSGYYLREYSVFFIQVRGLFLSFLFFFHCKITSLLLRRCMSFTTKTMYQWNRKLLFCNGKKGWWLAIFTELSIHYLVHYLIEQWSKTKIKGYRIDFIINYAHCLWL